MMEASPEDVYHACYAWSQRTDLENFCRRSGAALLERGTLGAAIISRSRTMQMSVPCFAVLRFHWRAKRWASAICW